MKIRLTKDHIDKGEGCDNKKCPIALAIKTKVPEAEMISVDTYEISFVLKCRKFIFPTSQKVAGWIDRFDCWYDKEEGYKKPRGFSFELDPANKIDG